jgi:hypothetical protein
VDVQEDGTARVGGGWHAGAPGAILIRNAHGVRDWKHFLTYYSLHGNDDLFATSLSIRDDSIPVRLRTKYDWPPPCFLLAAIRKLCL